VDIALSVEANPPLVRLPVALASPLLLLLLLLPLLVWPPKKGCALESGGV
jgi:hypothetical protein